VAKKLPAIAFTVFLDALRVKVRDAQSRQVKTKAFCVALGVTTEGEREVPSLWIASTEGAKFWLSVMNNLRSIRHSRSDQWRNIAHRRRYPDRRCPLLSYELSSSCAKLEQLPGTSFMPGSCGGRTARLLVVADHR
jgi:hypothetical protein